MVSFSKLVNKINFKIHNKPRRHAFRQSCSDSKNNNITQKSPMTFLGELKMAKTYFLVVCLCFFCYPPTVVSGIQNVFNYVINDTVINATNWANTLTSMNSTLMNCLLFSGETEKCEKVLKS